MPEKEEKIQVEVIKAEDSEEVKKLKEKLQEEKDKNELMREQEINRQMDEFNIKNDEKRAEFLANPEMWIGYKQALKEQKEAEKSKNKSGGTSCLTNEQLLGNENSGMPWHKQKFDNPKQMVDVLKERMNSDDPEIKAEARAVYDALLKKALTARGQSGESEGVGLKEIIKKPKKRDE